MASALYNIRYCLNKLKLTVAVCKELKNQKMISLSAKQQNKIIIMFQDRGTLTLQDKMWRQEIQLQIQRKCQRVQMKYYTNKQRLRRYTLNQNSAQVKILPIIIGNSMIFSNC